MTSADGRAGIGGLRSEIERLSLGSVLQQAARIELPALGRGASHSAKAESPSGPFVAHLALANRAQ